MWVLSCFTSKGQMNRAHAYKDAVAENLEHDRDRDAGIDMGLYTYPILMAADILIFRADEVPVGGDQIQHLQIARDIVRRLNNAYETDVFTPPEPRIRDQGATIPGVDGRKMSNSYGNEIPLFADPDELRERCMAIETDSTPLEEPMDPDDCNVFQIYRVVADDDQIEEMRDNYRSSDFGYGHAKRALFELLNDKLEEPRNQFRGLLMAPDFIDKRIKKGTEQVRAQARTCLDEVRRVTGIGGSLDDLIEEG